MCFPDKKVHLLEFQANFSKFHDIPCRTRFHDHRKHKAPKNPFYFTAVWLFACVQVTVYLAHTVRLLHSFTITRPGGLKCTKIAAATNDPQKGRTRATAGQLSVALCGLFCVFHSSFFLKGSLSPAEGKYTTSLLPMATLESLKMTVFLDIKVFLFVCVYIAGTSCWRSVLATLYFPSAVTRTHTQA